MDLLKSPISAVATSTAVGPLTTATPATFSGATPPGQSQTPTNTQKSFRNGKLEGWGFSSPLMEVAI